MSKEEHLFCYDEIKKKLSNLDINTYGIINKNINSQNDLKRKYYHLSAFNADVRVFKYLEQKFNCFEISNHFTGSNWELKIKYFGVFILIIIFSVLMYVLVSLGPLVLSRQCTRVTIKVLKAAPKFDIFWTMREDYRERLWWMTIIFFYSIENVLLTMNHKLKLVCVLYIRGLFQMYDMRKQ